MLIQGQGKSSQVSVKKLNMRKSRTISFDLIGQDINMDIQLKRATGFRMKSKCFQKRKIYIYIFALV